MPIVKLGDEGRWTNYHGTGTCEAATRFALRSGDAPRGRDEIAIAAKSVQDWLAQAATAKRRVRPLGAGWSPSNVNISSQSWLLHTRRFNRCFRIGADDVRSGIDAGTLMLVEAGALVDEVSDKFEEQGRSLWTSGAGNGQTFAGAAATGTHGSMIARGGIQDHIRAVQIVTPAGIHWIEPETGVMSDAFIAATGSAVLRDDAMFAAAQLPVGSLGIVTALIVDSVPKFLVRPIQNLRKVDAAALGWLAAGDFRRFSAAYALDQDPDFVQMIVNPYKPFKRPAMLRFLYREPWRDDYSRATPGQLGAGYDALSLLGRFLNDYPWARGALLQFAMKQGLCERPRCRRTAGLWQLGRGARHAPAARRSVQRLGDYRPVRSRACVRAGLRGLCAAWRVDRGHRPIHGAGAGIAGACALPAQRRDRLRRPAQPAYCRCLCACRRTPRCRGRRLHPPLGKKLPPRRSACRC
jgi:hypothetical protein